MDLIIAPIDYEIRGDDQIGNKIATWEEENNVKLPNSYRKFLERFNGGYVYPNVFKINADINEIGLNDDLMFFDIAYDFDYAIELWNREVYYNGTPEGFFFFGSDPGGFELLISLRQKDYGHVYGWFHSTYEWGTEGNTEASLVRQSDSFEAFLNSLHDTNDQIGKQHWETPKAVQTAIKLTLY